MFFPTYSSSGTIFPSATLLASPFVIKPSSVISTTLCVAKIASLLKAIMSPTCIFSYGYLVLTNDTLPTLIFGSIEPDITTYGFIPIIYAISTDIPTIINNVKIIFIMVLNIFINYPLKLFTKVSKYCCWSCCCWNVVCLNCICCYIYASIC